MDADQKNQEILEKLDLVELTFKMSQAVQELLNGDAPTEAYEVHLALPKSLLECVRMVADAAELDFNELLTRMANQGVQQSLQTMIAAAQHVQKQQQEPQPTSTAGIEDAMKAAGLDMSKFTEGLGKLNEVVNKVQQMQEQIEHVEAATKPTPKDPKDPE